MCFFSAPKQQAAPVAPPPPAPLPLPSPSDPNPSATSDQRRLQIANLKKGFASTIVNAGGPQGITGKGPDINAPAAGGASTMYGTKATVGS